MDIFEHIANIYFQYLKEKDAEYDNEGMLSASSAGGCYKAHALRQQGKKGRDKGLATLNYLRTGTLWGDDVEASFEKIGLPGYTTHIQEKLYLKKYGVIGHVDAFFLSHLNIDEGPEDQQCIIIDEKHINQWAWKYAFDPQKESGKGYKMQLGTYAMMIHQKYEVPIENFRMALLYGNRSDGYIKPMEVNPLWIEEAHSYWKDLTLGMEQIDFTQSVPGAVHGVPLEDWACGGKKKYCEFAKTEHCSGLFT